MKNNNRIIKFLRKQFNFIYYLFIVNLIVGGILNVLGIIFPAFPLAELYNIRFEGGTHLYSPSSYQLLGSGVFIGDAHIRILLNGITSSGFNYRLLSFFDNTILSLTLVFLFKNAKVFFDNLIETLKSGENFNKENYLRIKRIGYWFAAFVIYRFVKGILFSHFLLKDVTVLGQKLKLHPDYIEWPFVFFVLVVFAFAEIYRVAVHIKEESELTI
ncbi:DUF2975 domain-containing protein [Ancylomarina sp.]|uniref:DUF2975 domain-containing protein n=1 Tax=Ancylomarina sp. TaxID=1970196 RepID=UPI003562A053